MLLLDMIMQLNFFTFRSDATSIGHTLAFRESPNNTGGPTECHIDMWLDNSNSNNTGASIGVVEDSNDGYADLVFKTTAATNSDTLYERVRFDREGGVLIAGQPIHASIQLLLLADRLQALQLHFSRFLVMIQ